MNEDGNGVRVGGQGRACDTLCEQGSMPLQLHVHTMRYENHEYYGWNGYRGTGYGMGLQERSGVESVVMRAPW